VVKYSLLQQGCLWFAVFNTVDTDPDYGPDTAGGSSEPDRDIVFGKALQQSGLFDFSFHQDVLLRAGMVSVKFLSFLQTKLA